MPEFLQDNWPYLLLIAAGALLLWKYGQEFLPKFKLGGGASSARVLDIYTVDLTAKAKKGEIDPVVGREEEIERMIQILSRRKKNNPILIGAAGVGKTAIVEGLALRIVTSDVPLSLRDKRVLALNLADMIGGTKYRGEFEERVKKLVDEIIIQRRNIILFIDEIHTLIQTKGTEGAMNVGDILKPALARGELQSIGATTTEEYEKYFKTDEALVRRFQIVEVGEPTPEQTIEILKGIKKEYEDHHRVEFTDEAIEAAVTLSHQYIKGRLLPDKAIDLMDEAGAMVNLKAYDLPNHALKLIRAAAADVHAQIAAAPERIKGLLEKLEQLKIEKENSTDERKNLTAKKEILSLTSEIENLETRHKSVTLENKKPTVSAADVKKVLAGWLNIAVEKIN
ncbi:hypothetical protein A2482_00955 [Candidatus Falkowbacteria bacterium RIFOXYC2_FULL_48_21]|uniref:AAA+ ATPase domain-containing protein n=1 Tax=Candidatus Falkowbacteria bacterium RIFOXYC2_FULL_48_21 TaxID=1798005 RepID=A0A1F5TGW6_9BACT|nr:MAG: hypothetical protein A2482_00955 [Candidatus Falkowbacteria bacterium RIFOXYC2_FULL_48_21]